MCRKSSVTNKRVSDGTALNRSGHHHLWWLSLLSADIFALLLAAFEMATGILILSKGRYVKIGLVASVLFNLFLVQLGLGFPEIPWTGRDFLLNRLPTLLFALLQLPLFWVHFNKSPPDLLSTRLR